VLLLYHKIKSASGAIVSPKIRTVKGLKKIAAIGRGKETVRTIIELPESLAAALKSQANAHGASADVYARELLKRDLASSLEPQSPGVPFKTGRGIFAKYGQAPSAEEIDANRADMFRNFGEDY